MSEVSEFSTDTLTFKFNNGMKNSLLLIAFIILRQFAGAQCGTMPPPGLTPRCSVDLDNNGFAPFDIGYYVANDNRSHIFNLEN